MNNGKADDAPGHNKTYNIILNGTPVTVSVHRLSYEAVVALAFPNDPKNDDIVYTVTYANPHGRDGTLAAGQDVTVRDGMSFNVRKTNRS